MDGCVGQCPHPPPYFINKFQTQKFEETGTASQEDGSDCHNQGADGVGKEVEGVARAA